MNEITRIHLGRQPFTISVESHAALKKYLESIRRHVGDDEVVQEVELRMAELLTERGISGDKVILPSDIDYLKQQLGDPKDFTESEAGEETPAQPSEPTPKKLYRETQNAMLAGVANGLSSYLGVDVLIIRLLFVIGTFTGGWGLLIYIVLWLLVPEAKTSSDRLQMKGSPITVNGIKDAIEQADIKGAATRANGSLVPVINTVMRISLKVIAVSFVLVGLSLTLLLSGIASYTYANGGQFFQENLFPVGSSELLLLSVAFALAGIVCLFIMLFGVAIFKRHWPMRAWATGTLIGIFLIGVVFAGVLAANVAPKVEGRYKAAIHTTSTVVEPFETVHITGSGADVLGVEYRYATTYSVNFEYFGTPDISKIKSSVQNGTLEIDTDNFEWRKDCDKPCLFPNYDMKVIVRAPVEPRIHPNRPVADDTDIEYNF